jgi:hypothetical protein
LCCSGISGGVEVQEVLRFRGEVLLRLKGMLA